MHSFVLVILINNHKNMKKIISIVSSLAIMLSMVILPSTAQAITPSWNMVGTYQWLVLDTYAHDVIITTQNLDGTFSGTGRYPVGDSPYTGLGQTSETITGYVIGNDITFTTTYTGPYNPGYTVTVTGTIAPDGVVSGTSPWPWQFNIGTAKAVGGVCPVNTTQNYIETVTVNSAIMAGTNSSTLVSGQNYYFDVNGTWTNRPGETVDAKYTTMDNWLTNSDAPSGGYLNELLDLQINNAFVDWGLYSPLHIYSRNFVGNGSVVNFSVFDGEVGSNTPNAGWYGDNVGNLTVNIYSCTPNEVPPTPPAPTNKEECKKGGWENSTSPKFRNQGQCVSYFQANEKAGKKID